MKPILFIFFSCCTFIAYTQSPAVNPAIQWQKSLGGTSWDIAYDIKATADGGYIVAGVANSNDGDVSGLHGSINYGDYWIVKLDSSGNIQWQKCLGGSSEEGAYSIQQTKDGGYIAAGHASSIDGDVSGNHGGYDYWVVKLDGAGTIQWQKSLGGTNQDDARSIQQTKDGGYIVAGYSYSNDGDVSGHHGSIANSGDYWIVKLNGSGTIQWQKSLGGTYREDAKSIQQTKDGGYIVAGWSYSDDGDVSGHHGSAGSTDYWIVKLDSAGAIQWQKSLGGTDTDLAWCIRQTKDDGYIVAGSSFSNDGDVIGHHDGGGFGNYDYWIVKLNGTGTIQWQKCLGGANTDVSYSIQQTKDGGYIAAGASLSNDGDVSGNHGGYDYWVVKLSSYGNIQKEGSFGGTSPDFAYSNSIQQTKDGGYIVAGSSQSNDGDVSGHHGSNTSADYWIVKLKSPKSFATAQNNSTTANSNAVAEKNIASALLIQPNPSQNGMFTADMGAMKNNVFISVTDNSGRQVYKKQLSSAKQFSVHLNNKPKGIYYLHVSYDGGKETATLVIE